MGPRGPLGQKGTKGEPGQPITAPYLESSGALILKDVRPEDEGLYSCEARNLLGSVNASAKLIVQCKSPWSI